MSSVDINYLFRVFLCAGFPSIPINFIEIAGLEERKRKNYKENIFHS